MKITVCKMMYKGTTNQKKAKTVLDKRDMEVENIVRNKECHFITIKGTTHWIGIKIPDLCGTTDNIISNYTKQI